MENNRGRGWGRGGRTFTNRRGRGQPYSHRGAARFPPSYRYPPAAYAESREHVSRWNNSSANSLPGAYPYQCNGTSNVDCNSNGNNNNPAGILPVPLMQNHDEKDITNEPHQPHTSNEKQPLHVNIVDSISSAIRFGRYKEFDCLLKDKNVRMRDLNSALVYACDNGHKFFVQKLVYAGASVRGGMNSRTDTALHISARKGFLDIAHFLLLKGADVNAFNNVNETPLLACINPSGCTNMVRLLVSNGAKVHFKNNDGMTALMKATEALDIDVMRFLLHHGSDLDTMNKAKENARAVAKRMDLADIFDSLHYEAVNAMSVTTLTKAMLDNKMDVVRTLLDCQGSKHMLELDSTAKTSNDKMKSETLKDLMKHVCSNANAGKSVDSAKFQIAQILLENGAQLGKNYNNCDSALIEATMAGAYDLVKVICRQKKIGLNAMNKGRSALMIAAEKGHANIVDLLISMKGIGHYQMDNKRDTALILALTKGHLECASILFKKSPWLPSGKDLKEMVMKIIKSGQSESLKLLIKHRNSVITLVCEHLGEAVESQSLEMLMLVVEMGGDVNAIISGQSLLVKILKSLYKSNSKVMESMAKFVIEKGANVNKGDSTESPLLWAVQKSSMIVSMLIEQGADVNEAGDGRGTTPLIVHCYDEFMPGKADTLQLLLQAGVDVNKCDNFDNTPLHRAVCNSRGRQVQLVSTLLDNGAKTDVKDGQGRTPLHHAATIGHRLVIEKLINHGADLTVVENTQGCNAFLRMVCGCRDPPEDDLRLLIGDSKYLIDSRTSDGYTALMQAARQRSESLITSLIKLGADIHVVKEDAGEKITALSILLDSGQIGTSLFPSIKELITSGGLTSVPKRCCLSIFQMIMTDRRSMVELMVCNGMVPLCVDFIALSASALSTFMLGLGGTSFGRTLSPFAAALIRNRISIAKYLCGNWFLTPADTVGAPQLKELRIVLEATDKEESMSMLDNHMAQPMPLKLLAFVTVSSCLGDMEGREERLRQTGLPSYWQERLMFRHQNVEMDYTGEEAPHPYGPDNEYGEDDVDSMDYSNEDYNFSGDEFDPFDYYDARAILGALRSGYDSDSSFLL